MVLITLLSGALTAAPAWAKITPASLFTDSAVLQQKQAIPVWGTSEPNEPITVSVGGQSAKCVANAAGEWAVKLNPIPAGGPYTLVIAGTTSASITLNNVLVGEVWICGGQSNMQYGLKGWMAANNAPAPPSDPLIHFAIVPTTVGVTPQKTVSVSWREFSSENSGGLTAIGYFFARELRKSLGVPVGLIHDNVGGSPAEAWVSKEALAASDELKHYVDEEQSYPARYPKMLEEYNAKLVAYTADKAKFDADVDAAKAAGSPVPTKAPVAPYKPTEYEKWMTGPSHLYNGMIAPVAGYGIRGAIWYQGEANCGYLAPEYRTLFPALITDWRKRWGQGDFPFYYVQLAGFTGISQYNLGSTAAFWAATREAQRLTLKLPNTGMATITDLGDVKNVHPKRKEPVGVRLSLIARALTYGEKGLEYSGPVLDSVKYDGALARVTFTHAAGLHPIEVHDASDDGQLIAAADKVVGFEIAGADGKYVFADAKIDGNAVLVSNDKVKAPTGVRYGFMVYPVCNLTNGAGLPASPFKADDWPWMTPPK
jgi:sialate O-acetylesterase